jgi:hypothetical protein
MEGFGTRFTPRERVVAAPAAGRVLMRAVLATALIAAGMLACAYGVLIYTSITRSDTVTRVLVGFGLAFVIPGLAAIDVGTRLLRGRPSREPAWSLVQA